MLDVTTTAEAAAAAAASVRIPLYNEILSIHAFAVEKDLEKKP